MINVVPMKIVTETLRYMLSQNMVNATWANEYIVKHHHSNKNVILKVKVFIRRKQSKWLWQLNRKAINYFLLKKS